MLALSASFVACVLVCVRVQSLNIIPIHHASHHHLLSQLPNAAFHSGSPLFPSLVLLLSPSLHPTLITQVGCQSWMATCKFKIALMSSHRGLKPKSSSVSYTPSCSLSWCLRSGWRLSSVCSQTSKCACLHRNSHPSIHAHT
jgi:hypothetical protein